MENIEQVNGKCLVIKREDLLENEFIALCSLFSLPENSSELHISYSGVESVMKSK